MPRRGTTDANAELAVRLYQELLAGRGWQLDRAWLPIAMLLMTCDVWRSGGWHTLLGAPVLRESNDYRLTRRGAPNKALAEALQVKQQIAAELATDQEGLCSELGLLFRQPELDGLQPNNPKGHAFRSLVAETLAGFGDPELEVIEEVSPSELFPDFVAHAHGRDARIDIAVRRGPSLVALIATQWTYRHTRARMLNEARAHMPAARRISPECRFFGVTAEFMTARLRRVIGETSPAVPSAVIDRLVHLNPELPGELIGKNGDLRMMWSFEQMVEDSHNWG